jgi:Secretion system C-terminal sorting domain/Cep192 domain 4
MRKFSLIVLLALALTSINSNAQTSYLNEEVEKNIRESENSSLIRIQSGSEADLVFILNNKWIDSLDFDSVWVDSTKIIEIGIKNEATVELKIISSKISGSDSEEFLNINDLKDLSLEPQQEYYFNLSFTPNSLGQKSSKLFVEIKDADEDAELVLTGVGVDMTSVDENTEELDFEIVSISPNPAAVNVSVEFKAEKNASIQFSVADLEGKKIMVVFDSNTVGSSTFDFSVDALNSGAYYLVLESNNRVVVKKFIVSK